MIWPAVMVVPLTVPRTSTRTPFLIAPAALALLMVTVWPAEVEIVKPDVDTLATAPIAPPAAGPDRALPDGGAAVLAAAGPVPELALTMPYAPPATVKSAAPAAIGRLRLRENMLQRCGDVLSAP
jgi:hypothetical protein